MQPAYRVGRMASATQPRRREQVIFKMTVMMMKVMVMKVMVMMGECTLGKHNSTPEEGVGDL